jgi:hypothetical protein
MAHPSRGPSRYFHHLTGRQPGGEVEAGAADGFTPALIDAVVAAPNRYIATLVEVGYYDALFGTGFLDGEQGEFPPFMTTG